MGMSIIQLDSRLSPQTYHYYSSVESLFYAHTFVHYVTCQEIYSELLCLCYNNDNLKLLSCDVPQSSELATPLPE